MFFLRFFILFYYLLYVWSTYIHFANLYLYVLVYRYRSACRFVSRKSAVYPHTSLTRYVPQNKVMNPLTRADKKTVRTLWSLLWPRHSSLGPVLLNIDVRQVAPLQERRTSQSWLYRSSCFAVRRVRYCLLLWRTEAGQRSTHSRTKDSSTYFHEPTALSGRHCCASKHVSLLVSLSLWRAGKRGSSRLLKLLWEQRWTSFWNRLCFALCE